MSNNEQLIKACLYNVVRPQIQSHNGDVEFVSYKDDIVSIRLKGACIGCPIAFYTVKMGVFEELKKVVPTIQEVIELSS